MPKAYGIVRSSSWLVAGAVLLLSFLAYAPTLHYGYVWDASYAVERNPVVERGNLLEILTSDYWAGAGLPSRTLYRPVTVLSFAIERRVVGEPEPLVSHLVNIFLHDLTALLLFTYIRRLGGRTGVATIAALLFTVHPVLLQAVVNVAGRSEILATLFSLAALLCMSATGGWGSSSPSTPKRQRLSAWGAAFLLFLALGSKEVAVATPFLLLAQQLLVRLPDDDGRAWWTSRAASLAPSALAVAVHLILRTLAIEAFPGLQAIRPMDNVLVGMEGLPRLATSLAMAARYGRLLFFPANLSADYSGTVIAREWSLMAPLPLAGFLMISIFAVLAFAPLLARYGFKRWRPSSTSETFTRLLSMGALLFLLPYLVIGNILVLNGAGFAERLIYFSTTGFCFLSAVALLELPGLLPTRRVDLVRRAALLLVGILLLMGALHARKQSRMWQSDEALLEHALLSTPRSLRAHFALAEIRMNQGRKHEALELYEEALQYSPDHAASWMNKGILLGQEGDLVAAEGALRRSIQIRPTAGEAYVYLGDLLSRTRRFEEAERALRKALRLHPGLVEAAAQLGHLLFQRERYSEAARYYRRCVRLGRSDLVPHLKEAEARAGRRSQGSDG